MQADRNNRVMAVSIHAPREGCDEFEVKYHHKTTKFQFTHPGRGATLVRVGDLAVFAGFNSRTPGGVRHGLKGINVGVPEFQFTHPGRGATRGYAKHYTPTGVSIHAPREGCDC